jgi:hypothetical protein
MNIQEQMREKLLKTGIPAKEVKCYGSQIMVTTYGLAAAQRWHSLLGNFCSKVRSGQSVDYNAENRNTVLRPTTHKVWRVWGTL